MKIERFVGPAAALVSFGVYLSTLAPGVTFWDSGELICGAVGLGIPHPPGYPIFCILGKAFCMLPIGSAAYRINLLSAFFASATVYLLYRLIILALDGWACRGPFAASAALCFAFYPGFWGVSGIAEVYSLNTFMICLVAWSLLKYDMERRLSHLYLSSFLLALALFVHQSIVFFLPAYAAYFLLADKNYKRPTVLVTALFFFMLGFSVMLYLPVRAVNAPLINVGNPVTPYWIGWDLKLKEHYNTLVHLPGMASVFIKTVGAGLALSCLVGITALAYLLRKRGFVLMASFAVLCYFIGTRLLTADPNGIDKWGLQTKFYIPVVLFGIIAAAGIIDMLIGKTARKVASVPCAFALTLTVLAGGIAYRNYHAVDHSRDFFANDFATNTLKAVKEGGALFAWGDNGVFPVWYLQGVEKYRDDVFFIHTELLSYPWYMGEVQRRLYERFGIIFTPPAPTIRYRSNVPILRLMLEKRTPTYFDYSAMANLKERLRGMRPQGLIYLTPTGVRQSDKKIWAQSVIRGVSDESVNRDFAAEGILDIYAWQAMAAVQYAFSIQKFDEGIWVYDLAKSLGLSNAEADRAVERVKRDLESRRGSAQIRSK